MEPAYALIGGGIAPSELELGDVLRGGTIERSLKIFNHGDEEVIYSLHAGEYSQWVSMYDTNGNFSEYVAVKGGTTEIVILKFMIPETAPNGDYNFTVSFVSKPPENSGKTGISVNLPVKVHLTVTGKQRVQVNVLRYEAKDTEVNIPARFKVDVVNEGNVDAILNLRVDILKDGELIGSVTSAQTIGVGKLGSVETSWNTADEKAGEYVASFHLFAGEREVFSGDGEFNIYERGTLTASIEVLEVKSNSEINPGNSKIETLVSNSGLIDYEAKLKVEIYKGGNFLNVVESEPVFLKTGEKQKLTAYFQLDEPGEYVLRPLIYFGGKIAIINETKISVAEGSNSEKTPLPFSLAIIGFAVALFIAGYLRRE
jgi:hypothetical protein